MSTSSEGFSGRQIASFAALWLGWTLAFALAQTMIDSLLRNRMPQPGIAVMIFAAALSAIFFGRWLWPGWRGSLGLISIVFALFGGAVALVRRGGGEALARAQPATSLVAVVISMVGSMVLGALLLHAERQRSDRTRKGLR